MNLIEAFYDDTPSNIEVAYYPELFEDLRKIIINYLTYDALPKRQRVNIRYNIKNSKNIHLESLNLHHIDTYEFKDFISLRLHYYVEDSVDASILPVKNSIWIGDIKYCTDPEISRLVSNMKLIFINNYEPD